MGHIDYTTIKSKTIYESTTGCYRDEDIFLCVLYAHIYMHICRNLKMKA